MSYESFIKTLSDHARNRLREIGGDAAERGRVFEERVNSGLKASEQSVKNSMRRMRDSDAESTLNAEFEFFVALHAAGPEGALMSSTGERGTPWWPRFAARAKVVLDSLLDILGKWLSDTAKRAILLAKEMLDLFS